MQLIDEGKKIKLSLQNSFKACRTFGVTYTNMTREEYVTLESKENFLPIDQVIRRRPYYTTVRLITSQSLQFTPKPFLREVSTTTNLMEIIRQKKSAYESYIEAIPLDQVDLDPAFQNKLQFYGPKDEVIIHLDQASYQKLPNLHQDQKHDRHGSLSSFDYSQVKKLTNDKIGHGENNYSRYRYKIKIEFSQPEFEFIIKTLFNNVRAESYIYDRDMEFPTPPVHKDTVSMPILSKNGLELDDYTTNTQEFITLFTHLGPLQITNSSQFETFPLTRYTMHNVYCESITGTDWEILSLHTKDTHMLIHKDENVAIVHVEK